MRFLHSGPSECLFPSTVWLLDPPGHLTASQYLFPAGPYGVESFVFRALNPWVSIALDPWLPAQISRASFLCHSLFPAILFHKFSHLSSHIFVHFLLSSSGQKKYTCVLPTCPAICKFSSGPKLGLSWYPSITYHKLVHSVSNIWKLLYSFVVVYSKITDLVPVTLSKSKVTSWIFKICQHFLSWNPTLPKGILPSTLPSFIASHFTLGYDNDCKLALAWWNDHWFKM